MLRGNAREQLETHVLGLFEWLSGKCRQRWGSKASACMQWIAFKLVVFERGFKKLKNWEQKILNETARINKIWERGLGKRITGLGGGLGNFARASKHIDSGNTLLFLTIELNKLENNSRWINFKYFKLSSNMWLCLWKNRVVQIPAVLIGERERRVGENWLIGSS